VTDTSHSSHRWLQGWRGNLLLLMVSLVLCVVVAELGLRIAGKDTPEFYRLDPDVGWRPRPEVSGWIEGETETFVAMNRDGYRDVDHKLAKPPDTYRIVLLGDSMTEAVEVPLDDTYWRRLIAPLQNCRTDGKAVEVVNFGVNGYGTAQEYLTLKEWGLNYHPDLVLLAFFTGNDFTDNSLALGKHEGRPYFALKDRSLDLVRRPGDQPGFAAKQRWLDFRALTIDDIRLVQLFRRASRNLRNALKYRFSPRTRTEQPGLDNAVFRPPTTADWIASWGVTEALIAATADTAHAGGAAFALTTLSNPLQVLPDPAERQRIAQSLGVDDLTYPDRRLAAFATAHSFTDVPLVDPMAAYAAEHHAALHGTDPREPIGHWNALGNQVAAEALARGLCEAMAAGRLAPPLGSSR
jgi:lysophospholipase L1-like esterase